MVSAYTSSGTATTKVVPAGYELDNRTGQMGPAGASTIGKLEVLSQNVSYGFPAADKDVFVRYQNLGREVVSSFTPNPPSPPPAPPVGP